MQPMVLATTALLAASFPDEPVELETGTTQPLVGVAFVDELRGFAVGGARERGTPAVLIGTADGGRRWKAIDTGLETRLYDVAFATPDRAFACGLGGALLRTTDGGRTWSGDASPFDERDWLAAPVFVEESTGFLAGQDSDGALLARTIDGGASWESLADRIPGAVRKHGLRDIHFVDAKLGFASGAEGTLLRTRDGGDRWEICSTGVEVWLRSVSFADERFGLVGGSGGALLLTDDGGESWSRARLPEPEKVNSVARPTRERAWAATMEGSLWTSPDGGRTWSRIHRSEKHIAALAVAPGGTVWAACGNGKVLRIPAPR